MGSGTLLEEGACGEFRLEFCWADNLGTGVHDKGAGCDSGVLSSVLYLMQGACLHVSYRMPCFMHPLLRFVVHTSHCSLFLISMRHLIFFI